MLAVTPNARLLARLAEDGASTPQMDGLSPLDVAHLLRRNKFPLLALEDRLPSWLTRDAAFQDQLRDEREWYETQHVEYALVQRAWLEQGIHGLMIKSAGNRPSFPYLSDNIDVAVRPENGPAARETLRRLGYVELRNIEEPRKYLFRKFHAGRSVSAIHVHEQVIWLVGFMDEDALWARMRRSDDDPLVNVPSPEDSILINLAHACYENKLLRFLEVARVRHALRAAHGQLDWAYMERVARSRGWLDGLAFMVLVYGAVERALFDQPLLPDEQRRRFEDMVRADPPVQRRLDDLQAAAKVDLPLDLSYWFCKRLYYRKILADPAVPVNQRRRDVVSTLLQGIKLKSRLRLQRGAVVAISGPDGSGKTAHARALVDVLRLSELSTAYFWSRGGSTGLLSLANAVRRRLESAPRDVPSQEDTIARRRRRTANPMARFLWSWLVALDQIACYAIWARWPTLFGRLVVSDRYVYDTAVELEASLPPSARWSRLAVSTMLRLVPRPNFAYVLDLPPSAARERKRDEVWHTDLEHERQAYRALAERLDLRVLSTDGSFAEASDPLIRELMMAYMADFETWPNGLFMANPSQRNNPDPVWANGAAR